MSGHRSPFARMLHLVFSVTLWFPTLQNSLLYKNPHVAVEDRINDLLSRMTLEEKIGQMVQIDRTVANTSVIRNLFVGSIISGPDNSLGSQASPYDWMDMLDGFQKDAMSTRLGIPLIHSIDAGHGNSDVYGATIFPHNIGLGCTRDPNLVKRIGAATALEVRGIGMHHVLSPCIAVCRHPSWGRCFESFSEDSELVRTMTDVITGLQGAPFQDGFPFVAGECNVAATAKHYVGDGGTFDGIDAGNTIMSFRDLLRIHMPPYIDAIAKGVSIVMISYSSWNGLKMHANHFLISHVLKEHLNFQGFVSSDWEGLDRITNPWGANYKFSVEKAINAGIDMVMVPYNYTMFYKDMLDLVYSGAISLDRLDDAVRRVLRVKFLMGLFENPYSNRTMAKMVGAQEHRNLAREAVRRSIVLLKNSERGGGGVPILPLNKDAHRILVAGSHANNIGFQCGGWTISWQGSSGNITVGVTLLEAIRSTVSTSTEVVYEESPDMNFLVGKAFSYAIVAVGETPYADSYGDNRNLTIPDEGLLTIKTVCATVKCVVVLISGRPLVLEPYLPLMDAIIAAWFPGTEGKGITDVLFGDYPFTGKLSRTWFRSVDQLPMNIGDKQYDPLFPYGYGLTISLSHDFA